MCAEVRKEIERHLTYAENTAGDLMTTEFVRLGPAITVEQALDYIRATAHDRESIYACYIVEPGSDKLLGAVSLRDLVMADPCTAGRGSHAPHPVTVNTGDPQKEVVLKISKYNLLAVPVLEADSRVVGFVTVDDAIDAMVEEQTDTVLRMGAVEAGGPGRSLHGHALADAREEEGHLARAALPGRNAHGHGDGAF